VFYFRKRVMNLSESFFKVLFESIQEGLILVDKNGSILMTNPSIHSMFGFEVTELIGQRIEVLVPKENRENHVDYRQNYHKNPVKRTMGSGIHLNGQRKDGSIFPVEVSLNPFTTDAGERYVVALVSDVTTRMQSEIKILQKNKELEQFAHIAAHDLKEPLRGITTYLSIFLKKHGEKLNEESYSYINKSYNNTLRLKQLINDILDFSKSGEIGHDMVDLNEVVDFVFSGYINQNILFNKTDLPSVIGDKTSLTQLMNNLIDNAIKFHDSQSTPSVSISYNENSSHWIISVADNGIGIDPKYQNMIFQVFKRLHSVSDYAGTGIGLATCKRIISAMGGEIWFEANQPNGTIFKFTIPKHLNHE
jgi:PAS domain S-box-containing protein